MAIMLSNGAVEADKLFTRLTVQLQLSLLMVSTVEGILLLLEDVKNFFDVKSSWRPATPLAGTGVT